MKRNSIVIYFIVVIILSIPLLNGCESTEILPEKRAIMNHFKKT